MENKLKIRISNEAFDFINNLLLFHDEYDCICLSESTSNGCCKSSKIDILLDNCQNSSIVEDICGLNVCYNSELVNKFKDVTIILKNNKLYLKLTPLTKNILLKSSKCNSCLGCNSKTK